MRISIEKARADFAALLDRAYAGETVTVVDHEGRSVQLSLVKSAPRRPVDIEHLKGTFQYTDETFAPLSEAELTAEGWSG